jgi:hypothetical protein
VAYRGPTPSDLYARSLEARAKRIANIGLGATPALSSSQLRDAVFKEALQHLREVQAEAKGGGNGA